MTSSDYIPCGRTALFDGIMTGLDIVQEIRDKDDYIMSIIITDGEDNASLTHTHAKPIRKLIKKYENKSDWSITYIGKSADSWHRTKPVSKVMYEVNVPRQLLYRPYKPATSAVRRLREYKDKRVYQATQAAQQIMCK